MKVNKVVEQIMKDTNTTQAILSKVTNRKQQGLSRTLKNNSFKTNDLIEILEFMGYELVIQETKRGIRADGQMKVER